MKSTYVVLALLCSVNAFGANFERATFEQSSVDSSSTFKAEVQQSDLYAVGSAAGSAAYPKGPNLELTPGSLCDRPTERRYPEKIDYCARKVDTSEKRSIIRMYDQELGYRIGSMDRQQFKIDHFIPLCAGGSNKIDNLWPQHRTVYELTDPLEQLACEKMAQGRLKQNDAVALIREAKTDLSKVDEILEHVQGL